MRYFKFQFEAGRLLTFSAFRLGAYSRWALIRGWALIRINTVCRHEKYPGLVWTRTGTSRSHTTRIVLERLAEKVWTSLLSIYFRAIHFRYGSNSCSKCHLLTKSNRTEIQTYKVEEQTFGTSSI